jgi:hypothetical protein
VLCTSYTMYTQHNYTHPKEVSLVSEYPRYLDYEYKSILMHLGLLDDEEDWSMFLTQEEYYNY